jgi:hypothetical protein
MGEVVRRTDLIEGVLGPDYTGELDDLVDSQVYFTV